MQMVTENSRDALRSGLVIAYFGNSVAVETADGEVIPCYLRRNQTLPLVGDQVMWQPQAEGGVIVEIAPRRSQFARGDGHGKMKLIAANVDRILIVMAPPPIFSEEMVNDYLIAAELLGIEPVIVINKMDLLNQEEKQLLKIRLEAYQKIPYSVILSSIFIEDGLEDIKTILHDQTAVLVGPSGVGKSSLIAANCPQDVLSVGDVTSKGIGRHTTTATRLYHLPNGGCVIDSPGVREFNLWRLTPQEVWQGFKEFRKIEGSCKFRDCAHLKEPDCAVKAAVSRGEMSKERFASYDRLMREAKKS